MLRVAIALAAYVVLLGVCLLVPAGRLDWPAAWVYLAISLGFALAGYVLVDADLLRERASPGGPPVRSDVVLSALGFLGLYPGTLLVAGLDAGRTGSAVPAWGQAVAFAVHVAGYAFALQAMRENRFFATFVRIQEERGHALVDTGPYSVVRHPGYAGMLPAHLALPFALGSWAALVPAVAGAALFVWRTAREDRFLAGHLEGYRDYQARVRWRLAPGIW